ncbi:MAG: hypothetical protein Q8L29_01170 [archaeon]|nr:hypothetical protein [archaeon]
MKRGQVAIWVIVAAGIIIAFLLLFLVKRSVVIDTIEETNPQFFVQKCIKDSTLEALNLMLPQGGFVAPLNYKLYNNTKVTYLCENVGYYYPCINQHPMLLNEMKKEIKDYTQLKIEDCYSIMKGEFEKRQYSVQLDSDPVSLDVEFKPGSIDFDISKKVTLSKGEEVINFDKFNVAVPSHAYELGSIAVEITNQESKYCNFDYLGYMIIYSDFNIRKETRSDGTKIYIIIDKRSHEEMQFAIRGCVTPQGI